MLDLVIKHGYLGKDPKLEDRQGKNGSYKTVFFTLGVSRDYGDETDWYGCTMNGKRAEVIEKYFHKGSQIVVYGHEETYKAKDSDDTKHIIRLLGFDFCDSNSGVDKLLEKLVKMKDSEMTDYVRELYKQKQSEHKGEQTTEPEDSFEDIDEDVPF